MDEQINNPLDLKSIENMTPSGPPPRGGGGLRISAGCDDPSARGSHIKGVHSSMRHDFSKVLYFFIFALLSTFVLFLDIRLVSIKYVYL